MTITLLPAADWDTLTALCAGKNVLQAGYGGGHDTIALGMEALCLYAVDQIPGTIHPDAVDPFSQWQRTVSFALPAGRVLGSKMQFPYSLELMAPGVWQVAVVNLEAYRDQLVEYVLNLVLRLAPTVAVIVPGNWDVSEVLNGAAQNTGRTLVHCGRVSVLQYPAPAPAGDAVES